GPDVGAVRVELREVDARAARRDRVAVDGDRPAQGSSEDDVVVRGRRDRVARARAVRAILQADLGARRADALSLGPGRARIAGRAGPGLAPGERPSVS